MILVRIRYSVQPEELSNSKSIGAMNGAPTSALFWGDLPIKKVFDLGWVPVASGSRIPDATSAPIRRRRRCPGTHVSGSGASTRHWLRKAPPPCRSKEGMQHRCLIWTLRHDLRADHAPNCEPYHERRFDLSDRCREVATSIPGGGGTCGSHREGH